MAAVRGQIERAAGGVSTVTVLEGAPGLGKTSVARAAVSVGRSLGFRSAFAAADPGRGATEMGVVLEALLGGPDPLVDGAELGPQVKTPEASFWLLQEMQAQLETEALVSPLLICLDDLQWADGMCALALRTLPPALAAFPVAWVLTTRPGGGQPSVQAALEHLANDGATHLTLNPLDPAAVSAVAWDRLGAPADAELETMLAKSAGNPFMLIELLEGLKQEGLVAIKDGRWSSVNGQIPNRLDESIQRRLKRLSADAEHVVTVAASLGRRFALDNLGALLDRPTIHLVQPVAEATAAGLLLGDGDALTFQHDLAREAVRASVPSSVRLSLDRLAADVLLAAGAMPVDVVEQIIGSARPGDDAAIAILASAVESLALTDPAVACDVAARALALAPAHHPLRGPLVAKRAVALWASGQDDAAREYTAKALRQALPAEAEAEARLGLASMYVLNADARAEIVRGALQLTGISPAVRARLLASLFHNLIMGGRFEEADEMLGQATAAARDTADVAATYALDVGVALYGYARGEYAAAYEQFTLADARGSGGTDIGKERFVLSARGWNLVAMDRFEEGIALTHDALESAKQARQNWAIQTFEMWQGLHLLQRGHIDDANALLDGRHSRSQAGAIVSVLPAASLVALGRIRLHKGDRPGVAEVEDICKWVLDNTSTPATQNFAAWFLALSAWSAGKPDDAHGWLCRRGTAERLGLFPLFPHDAADDPLMVRIALAVDDRALAEHVFAHSLARQQSNPGVHSLAGVVAHCRGLLHESASDLGLAAQEFAAGQRPLARLAALEDLGILQAGSGDTPASVRSFEDAARVATDVGAIADGLRIQGRLASLGIRRRSRVVDRPAAGVGALTEAEFRVAALAADCCSNKQIAERLFISHHTVNTHLRHVFDKLGIRSRVELVRLAAQLDPAARLTPDDPSTQPRTPAR